MNIITASEKNTFNNSITRANMFADISTYKVGTYIYDLSCTGSNFFYHPDIVNINDYYPFGFQMVGRGKQGPVDAYRYGFNGKEKDDEGMGGGGSTYDYGFRIYNPSIAKFLSVDPLTKSYPWYTPYQFAGNKPIAAIDLDGLEERIVTNIYEDNGKGNWNYVKSESSINEEVGALGHGILSFYVDKDKNLITPPHFRKDILDAAHDFTAKIDGPNISEAMNAIGEIITLQGGLMVYGDADGNQDSPGTKGKDWFGSFDFSAFNELMSSVTDVVKNKEENAISPSAESVVNSYTEIAKKINKTIEIDKKNVATSSNKMIDACAMHAELGDTVRAVNEHGTVPDSKGRKIIKVKEKSLDKNK